MVCRGCKRVKYIEMLRILGQQLRMMSFSCGAGT